LGPRRLTKPQQRRQQRTIQEMSGGASSSPIRANDETRRFRANQRVSYFEG
jgi:hypothetical protein